MQRLLTILFAFATLSGATAAYASPEGIWLRANKESKISIEKCGDAFCGTVAWMIKENREKVDKHNENTDLNTRKILGIQIFSDMKPDGDKAWKGNLYNPEDGGTYSGSLRQIDENTLKLKGCWVWPLCKTDTWSKTTLEAKVE